LALGWGNEKAEKAKKMNRAGAARLALELKEGR
jgi:hypothetical protein